MTDEFLTKGLEGDRYLKALQLAEQFESEIIRVLRRFGDKMVTENPQLFEPGIEGGKHVRRGSSSTFAIARLDYPMDRVQSSEDGTQLKLNVHLYWTEPEEYNRTAISGALRAFGYKIKNVDSEDEEEVVAQTRDWDLHTAENPFGSRIAFYNHVSSAEEVEQTGRLLVEHFSKFGSQYGVPQDH